MTVNYTSLLGLGQPVTGTESGTWGDDVNNAVTAYLDIAIAGTQTLSTDADVTLSLTQGTSTATNIGSTTAQYAILNCTGARTAQRNISVPNASRNFVVLNQTTGGFAVKLRGVTGPTTGVTIANGRYAIVTWAGSDFVVTATNDITALSGTLPVTSGGTGATTLTGLVKGNGAGAFTAVAAPTGTVVGTTDTQTLTNKTLTSPVISTIVNTGTLTLPTITDTILGRTTTDTLTNKSISGASNTLTNIPNGALTNSSVTVNSVAISLGGSGTITAVNPNALTIGTGLSGTSYNGSAAVTIAIDSTVATLTGVQTLTNKSISGSTNTITNLPNSALTNSSLTINGVSISLGGTGTITASVANALTIGTGLSGTSYNGSAAVTIAIDSTVATLTGTQTLTNKTLTSPTINDPVVNALNTGQFAGMRNKIINGRMDIPQRGSSFVSPASGTFTVDRFAWFNSSSAAVTITHQQNDNPPGNEFQNTLRVAITTADTSITTLDYAVIQQPIEGYNVRDLIGKTFTLSFWVRSSKTGTHCVAFRNGTTDRSYVAQYTVNAANTWEQKSITVSGGLITAGTWNWTNGAGLIVSWALASGTSYQTTAGAWQTGNFFGTSSQVNCLDSNTNIFAITGVQLEIGSVATPFEHRFFGTELELCQRYFETSYPLGTAVGSAWTANDVTGVSTGYGSTEFRTYVYFKVTKRASPTIQTYDAAGTSGRYSYYNGAWFNGASTFSVGPNSKSPAFFVGISQGSATEAQFAFTADSEL